MRILIVSCGGVAAQRPLEWVVKAGHSVWLLGDEDFYPQNPPSNYRYFPSAWRRFADKFPGQESDEDMLALEMVQPLRQLVEEFQPEVIHVNAIGWHAQSCAMAGVRPLIVSAWGFLNHLMQPEVSYDKHSQRVSTVLANTDVLIVETPNLVDKSKVLLNSGAKVELIPLGTNPGYFRPLVSSDLVKWRRSVLKICEETIVLLSPRGWSKVYNHEQIFMAYAQAYPHFHKPTCLAFFKLARSSKDEAVGIYEKILGQAEQLKLTDKLHWMPNLPHIWMPTGYNIADVVVNYPKSDAFPVTLMEAVACQRPVISCDLPSYRGTFIEKFCRMVEPSNPAALAQAMIQVVNQSPSQRASVLAQARQVIVSEYDEAILQKRILKVYENLATASRLQPAVL